MSPFPIRWLLNAIINAMINAIFTGGVSHAIINAMIIAIFTGGVSYGVICIPRFHCCGIFISDYLFWKLLFSET